MMAAKTHITYRVHFNTPVEPYIQAGFSALEAAPMPIDEIAQICRVFRISADLLTPDGRPLGHVNPDGTYSLS